MEEIEYLEEYEDLILPSATSDATSVGVAAAATPQRSHTSGATMPGTPQQDDEDSSSIDQDIFESLFDDNSDDENILQKKADPKLSQRRDEQVSMDSLDMLVKDLGEQLAQSLTPLTGTQENDEQIEDITKTDAAGNKNKPTPKAPTLTSAIKERAPIAKSTKMTPSSSTSAGSSGVKQKPSSTSLSTSSKAKVDPKRLVKPKSVATVRPTVQSHPQKRINPAAKTAALRNMNASAAIRSFSGALSQATGGLKTAALSSRPSTSTTSVTTRPSTSSSMPFTPSAQKQIAAATSTTSTPASATSTPKGSSVKSTAQKKMVRPPPTIVKPEKLQTKDPIDDPLCLDDIGDLGSDSEFTLSDISADSFDTFSDLEDPENVIELSNDSSNGRRAHIKSLDNIVRRTPSPTVSEDFKSNKDDSGDDLDFHSLNNSSKTDDNLQNVDLLDEECEAVETTDKTLTTTTTAQPKLQTTDIKSSPNINNITDEVLLDSETYKKANRNLEKEKLQVEKEEPHASPPERRPSMEQEQTKTKAPTENENTPPTTSNNESGDIILEKTTTSQNSENKAEACQEDTIKTLDNSVENKMEMEENETLEESLMGEVAAEEIVCDTALGEDESDISIPNQISENEEKIKSNENEASEFIAKNHHVEDKEIAAEVEINNDKIEEKIETENIKETEETEDKNTNSAELDVGAETQEFVDKNKNTAEFKSDTEESKNNSAEIIQESVYKEQNPEESKNDTETVMEKESVSSSVKQSEIEKKIEAAIEEKLDLKPSSAPETSIEKTKTNSEKNAVKQKLIGSKEGDNKNKNNPISSKKNIEKPKTLERKEIGSKTKIQKPSVDNKKLEYREKEQNENNKNTVEDKPKTASKESIKIIENEESEGEKRKNERRTTTHASKEISLRSERKEDMDKSSSSTRDKSKDTNKKSDKGEVRIVDPDKNIPNKTKQHDDSDSAKDKPIDNEKYKSKVSNREKQDPSVISKNLKASDKATDKCSVADKNKSTDKNKSIADKNKSITDKNKSSTDKNTSSSKDKNKSNVTNKNKSNDTDNKSSDTDKNKLTITDNKITVTDKNKVSATEKSKSGSTDKKKCSVSDKYQSKESDKDKRNQLEKDRNKTPTKKLNPSDKNKLSTADNKSESDREKHKSKPETLNTPAKNANALEKAKLVGSNKEKLEISGEEKGIPNTPIEKLNSPDNDKPSGSHSEKSTILEQQEQKFKKENSNAQRKIKNVDKDKPCSKEEIPTHTDDRNNSSKIKHVADKEKENKTQKPSTTSKTSTSSDKAKESASQSEKSQQSDNQSKEKPNLTIKEKSQELDKDDRTRKEESNTLENESSSETDKNKTSSSEKRILEEIIKAKDIAPKKEIEDKKDPSMTNEDKSRLTDKSKPTGSETEKQNSQDIQKDNEEGVDKLSINKTNQDPKIILNIIDKDESNPSNMEKYDKSKIVNLDNRDTRDKEEPTSSNREESSVIDKRKAKTHDREESNLLKKAKTEESIREEVLLENQNKTDSDKEKPNELNKKESNDNKTNEEAPNESNTKDLISEIKANCTEGNNENVCTSKQNADKTEIIESKEDAPVKEDHKNVRSTRGTNKTAAENNEPINTKVKPLTKPAEKDANEGATYEHTKQGNAIPLITESPTTKLNSALKESADVSVFEAKDGATRRSLRKRCADSPVSINDAGKKLFKQPLNTSLSRSKERVDTPIPGNMTKRNLKSPAITAKQDDESPLKKRQKLDFKRKSVRLRNHDVSETVDDGWETDNSVTSQSSKTPEQLSSEVPQNESAGIEKSTPDEKTENSNQSQDTKAGVAAISEEDKEPHLKIARTEFTQKDATPKSNVKGHQHQEKLSPKSDKKAEQKQTARSLEVSPQRSTKGVQKSSGGFRTFGAEPALRKSQRSRAVALDETEEEDPLNINAEQKKDATATSPQKQQRPASGLERKSQRSKTSIVAGSGESKDPLDLKKTDNKAASPQKPTEIATAHSSQGTQFKSPTQKNVAVNRSNTKTETSTVVTRKATTPKSPSKSPGSTVMTLAEWLERQQLVKTVKNRLKQIMTDPIEKQTSSTTKEANTVIKPPAAEKGDSLQNAKATVEDEPDPAGTSTAAEASHSKISSISKSNSKQRKTAAKSKAIAKKTPKVFNKKSEIDILMDAMPKEMKDGGIDLLIRESRSRILKRDSLVATPVTIATTPTTIMLAGTAGAAASTSKEAAIAAKMTPATSSAALKTSTTSVGAARATTAKITVSKVSPFVAAKTTKPTTIITATPTDESPLTVTTTTTTSKIAIKSKYLPVKIRTDAVAVPPTDFKIPTPAKKPTDTATSPLVGQLALPTESRKAPTSKKSTNKKQMKRQKFRKCRVRLNRSAVAAYWRQQIAQRLLTSTTNKRLHPKGAPPPCLNSANPSIAVPENAADIGSPQLVSSICAPDLAITLAVVEPSTPSPIIASQTVSEPAASLTNLNDPAADQQLGSTLTGHANVLTIPPQNRRAPTSSQTNNPRKADAENPELSPQTAAPLQNESDEYLLTPIKIATPTAAVAIATNNAEAAPTTISSASVTVAGGGRKQTAQQKRNAQQTAMVAANKEKQPQPQSRTTKSTHVLRPMPKPSQVAVASAAQHQQQQQQQQQTAATTSTPQMQPSPMPQFEPKTELEDETPHGSIIAATAAGIPSGSSGVTPTVVDANGTRLYSYLHPAKYKRGHGGVLLDYCCPNLDGPMPAIDPTRIHSQVQSAVRELPAYIVMTTKLITRADLETNKNSIPASIRQKVEKITAATANANTTAAPTVTPASALPPPPPLTPTLTALQKQLPSATTIRPKIMGGATNPADAALPALTPYSVLEAALNAPPAVGVDTQRTLMRGVLRRFEMQLKRNHTRFGALTYTERQRIIESCCNSSAFGNAFTMKDIDTATRLLEEYARQMAALLVQPSSSSMATSAAATNPSTPAPVVNRRNAIFSAPERSGIGSVSTPQNTSAAAVAGAPSQQHMRRHVPIYDSDKNIIGYQLQVGANTKSNMSNTSTTTTTTAAINVSTGAASSNAASTSSSSLKLPPQESPRIFYTKALSAQQTSTPIAAGTLPPPTSAPSAATAVADTSTGAARGMPRLGRGITIRQIPQTASTSTTPVTAAAPRLPMLTRNPHITATATATAAITAPSPSQTKTPNTGVASTAPKRMTRKTAAAAAAKVIVITKDHQGNPQHSAQQMDECILPDDDNAAGGGTLQIKREQDDEDLISGN